MTGWAPQPTCIVCIPVLPVVTANLTMSSNSIFGCLPSVSPGYYTKFTENVDMHSLSDSKPSKKLTKPQNWLIVFTVH